MDEGSKRHSRQRAAIARSVGIGAIALGFISGVHGLEHPESIWLRTALGLLVTGMMAQGYALYCTLRRMREKHDSNTP